MDGTLAPGRVRGWWWRSTRAQRMAVAGVGAALGLALLIGAFAWMPTSGPPQAAPPPTPVTPLSTIAATSTTTTVTSTTTVATTTTSTVDTTTTTTTPATTVTTTRQLPPITIEPPITTIEPTSTTDDDVQYGVRGGMPCAPEGARGMTLLGVDMVCVAGSNGKLKWRKA
jgi:cytoskeletal protein RodZ